MLLSSFNRIKESTLFSEAIIESIRHNSYKAYKFREAYEFYGKYILASSRAKLTKLLYLKLILIWLIKRLYFDFVLLN